MEAKEKPWLRLYSEVVNDPKVQMLQPALFKLWVNLLCIARQGDGTIRQSQFKEYCWTLRVDEQALFTGITKEMTELFDEIEPGVWMPHGWKKRQYESDSSTERTRKFREQQKQKQENVPTGGDSQPLQRSSDGSGNVPGTFPERPQNTEADTETESPYSPPNESGNDSFVAGATEVDKRGDTESTEGESLHSPPVNANTELDSETDRDTENQSVPPRRRAVIPTADRPLVPYFVAFRHGKYPKQSPEWCEDFPSGEFDSAKTSLRRLHDQGATPVQVTMAAEAIRRLDWYRKDSQITLPTVVRHWTELMAVYPSASPEPSGESIPLPEMINGKMILHDPVLPLNPADGITLGRCRFEGRSCWYEHALRGRVVMPTKGGRRIDTVGGSSQAVTVEPVSGWPCQDGKWYRPGPGGVDDPVESDRFGALPESQPAPDGSSRVPVTLYPRGTSETPGTYRTSEVMA